MLGQTLKSVEDVFLFHKSHFTVDLRELWLAIGTEVLVPKAFHNLEILVHTTYHQQLLEGLWRLGQGIKLSLVHTAGHQKIPCAFGCGFDQIRGFNINKALVGQVFPDLHGHFMAKNQFVFNWIPANIQIAILHADVLATIGFIFYGKRREQGGIQYS